MYYFLIGFLVPFLITCNCKCDDKHDKKIQELKNDVEKIGSGFENLAFDVMEQIIEKVNGDYYMSDESASNEASTQHPTTKKIINNLLENTTQVYPTKKTEKEHSRRKRSVDESDIITNNISEDPVDNVIVESTANDTLCSTKTVEEKNLERQHIEELKEEVKKLYDLVVLLKDQQKIMSLLDQESNHVHSDLTKRFDTKDLLKILDHVNNKDGLPKDSDNEINPKVSDDNIIEKATHVELESIKTDLRAAIAALNKTKEILAMERRKELFLEAEIKDHRIELGFLKLMIQKLYENNTGFHRKDGDILGAPPHLPKELPNGKPPVTSNKMNDTSKPSGRSASGMSQRSSDDLDDLDRIIHKLRKPKKDDIESRISDLKREMERKKDEDLMKQLEELQKLVAEKEEVNSNHLPTEDLSLKKLLEALKGSDRPQSKALDDDVEVELQQLQKAIDKLRPKDDTVIRPQRDEIMQLRKVLNRVLKQQIKRDDPDIDLPSKNEPLTAKQIAELKRQLDSLNPDVGKGGNTNPSGGGYGYGYGYSPQFADMFGRGPPSQLLSGGGIGNYPHPYPSYRMMNGGGSYLPPSNPFTRYPLSGGYQTQNFGSSSNIKGGAIGQGSSGYNRVLPAVQTSQSSSSGISSHSVYQPLTDSQQKQYGGPLVPNMNSFGTMQQGISEQAFRGQLPISPYGAGPGVEQAFQEPQQRIVGANNPPNSFKPFPFPQASSGGQKETKNHFFLAPQSATYGETAPNPIYAQGGSSGGSQTKPGDYPQQNSGGVDYRYQKIDELRAQVESLQGVINSLNKPDYVQKPEDQATIVNLERQINDLKGVIQGLTQDLSLNQPNYSPNLPMYDQNNQPVYPRRRRSSEHNALGSEDSDLYDQVVAKVKQMLFENDTRAEGRSSDYYDDVQRRITNLKSQLEHHMHTSKVVQERHFNPPPSIFQHPYQSYNQYGTAYPILPLKPTNTLPTLIQQKKTDIFTSIVLKILDKLLAAAPAIIQKLLGFGFGQLFSFDYGGYNYGSDYSSGYSSGYNSGYNVGYNGYSGIQGIFKSLGLFGYIPLVILKIIDGITAFFKILKKNKFFRNFLLPAFVLLLVAGSVLFLIWWLQPDGESFGLEHGYDYNQNYDKGYKDYGYKKDYDRYPSGYQSGYHKPIYGYDRDDYGQSKNPNYPVYSRSYFEYR